MWAVMSRTLVMAMWDGWVEDDDVVEEEAVVAEDEDVEEVEEVGGCKVCNRAWVRWSLLCTSRSSNSSWTVGWLFWSTCAERWMAVSRVGKAWRRMFIGV